MFKTPDSRRQLYAYIMVFLGGLWTLAPLYLLFITAFKSWDEVRSATFTFLPQTWSLWGFQQAWEQGAKGIVDSSIVSVGTVLLSLSLGLPTAYAISRYNPGGRNLGLGILTFRFMPPVVLTVAAYLIAVQVKLIDSHLLLILMNSVFNVPFVAWIMKSFFDQIPIAIEEAAQIDGASWSRTVKDHVLPLARPGIIAVALFVAVFSWNELLFATILTASDVVPFTRVVPGLWIGRKYLLQPNWPAIAALGIIDVIAIALLASFLQKYIVRALSYGAFKGAVWE
jgi:multiple sugar transport system permease protein